MGVPVLQEQAGLMRELSEREIEAVYVIAGGIARRNLRAWLLKYNIKPKVRALRVR